MELDFDDDEPGLCRCGEDEVDPHPCPFFADVHDDTKTLCNCCAACQQECADDI